MELLLCWSNSQQSKCEPEQAMERIAETILGHGRGLSRRAKDFQYMGLTLRELCPRLVSKVVLSGGVTKKNNST